MAGEDKNQGLEDKEEDATEAQEDGANEATETDKHGHEAIAKGKYERDMAAKDQEIANLRKQVEEAAESKQGREELSRQIAELEEKLATEKLDNALKNAGCLNAKAAKAILGDYSGDIAKLKEACPYLFQEKMQEGGTTGIKPAGASSSARREQARKAAQLPPEK